MEYVNLGETIGVVVKFQNSGPASIAATQWRVVTKAHSAGGSGGDETYGDWLKIGAMEPGDIIETIGIIPAVVLGSTASPGDEIDVYLDCEILDASDNVLVSMKPVCDPWKNFFGVPQFSADWIKIISAMPYVVE